MTWFKVDDSFYDHPKVFDAPDCAVALWTRAGTWSARNLTEGFVPSGMPARLCDDPDTAAKELVRRGLWLRIAGGYRFHDWGDFQPSKESIEDLRTKRAAAGKLGGQAKAARQSGSKPLASASPVAKQNATPTRPDPKGREGPTTNSQGETSVTRAIPEPPPRCPKHHDDPDPPPCGPCADARRTHDRWERADADRRAHQPTCRKHRGQPAHNCGICRAEKLGDGAEPTGPPIVDARSAVRAAIRKPQTRPGRVRGLDDLRAATPVPSEPRDEEP